MPRNRDFRRKKVTSFIIPWDLWCIQMKYLFVEEIPLWHDMHVLTAGSISGSPVGSEGHDVVEGWGLLQIWAWIKKLFLVLLCVCCLAGRGSALVPPRLPAGMLRGGLRPRCVGARLLAGGVGAFPLQCDGGSSLPSFPRALPGRSGGEGQCLLLSTPCWLVEQAQWVWVSLLWKVPGPCGCW